MKEQALARTTPFAIKAGRYRPDDALFVFLGALRLCRPPSELARHAQWSAVKSRHNPSPAKGGASSRGDTIQQAPTGRRPPAEADVRAAGHGGDRNAESAEKQGLPGAEQKLGYS